MPEPTSRYEDLRIQAATCFFNSLAYNEERLDEFLQSLPPVTKDRPEGDGWHLVLVPRKISFVRLSLSWAVFLRPYMMDRRYGLIVHSSISSGGVDKQDDYYWVWLNGNLIPAESSTDSPSTCNLTAMEVCAFFMQYPQVFERALALEASLLCDGSFHSQIVDGVHLTRKLIVRVHAGVCLIDVQLPEEHS